MLRLQREEGGILHHDPFGLVASRSLVGEHVARELGSPPHAYGISNGSRDARHTVTGLGRQRGGDVDVVFEAIGGVADVFFGPGFEFGAFFGGEFADDFGGRTEHE
jgi:hypothetical protein